MTMKDILQGIEKPDVLETDLKREQPKIKLRITDIDTLAELITEKQSSYTAGGIAVWIVCV